MWTIFLRILELRVNLELGLKLASTVRSYLKNQGGITFEEPDRELKHIQSHGLINESAGFTHIQQRMEKVQFKINKKKKK